MKLSEAMREKMLLSFELFPPKTEKGMANLPGTIEHLMKYRPEYISCTYGAGGGKCRCQQGSMPDDQECRNCSCNTLHSDQEHKRRNQTAVGTVSGRWR